MYQFEGLMSVHLVSFGDSRMQRSLNRLAKQAKQMRVFESIQLFNESDLESNFIVHFGDKLVPGSRGFGYWAWKPEIILMALNKIVEGDCLLYIDAGCHLNTCGRQRLLEYFDILKSDDLGIVAFQAVQPRAENSALQYDGRRLFDQPNFKWIKGDLLDYFGERGNPSIIYDQAVGAGVILIKKTSRALSVILEWQELIWKRFDLLDDSPSISPNLPGFIEHRHDQAIWSILCLRHGVKRLSAYEYWYPKKHSNKLQPDWPALRNFPIHARRDKDLGVVRNFLFKLKLLQIRFLTALTRFSS